MLTAATCQQGRKTPPQSLGQLFLGRKLAFWAARGYNTGYLAGQTKCGFAVYVFKRNTKLFF